ncbi:MAG: hypothetical protein M0Q92_02275 [Methanoregula sp.]|nr:hypothetical protein [Methanoregula sp.]
MRTGILAPLFMSPLIYQRFTPPDIHEDSPVTGDIVVASTTISGGTA